MKKCNNCNTKKGEDCFSYKNKDKEIRSSICKICHRKYKKEYYHRNKESHYKRNQKQYKMMKEIIDENKVECLICGEKEKVCLDFHHIDGSLKKDNISTLVTCGSPKKLIEEIKKCVILCSNCHRKLHAGVVKLESYRSPKAK